jgi:ubiquinone/menaquinone biosynthesis C-methylase UbiE
MEAVTANWFLASIQTGRETLMSELREKYRLTAWFYDLLDYPWERVYRKWRPALLADVDGEVLEAGVGTGRNLPHYPETAHVTGFDLSPQMLRYAHRRAKATRRRITLLEADATQLDLLPDDRFDWYISTFMYCVMSDRFQCIALEQMMRKLKPGGRFRLLEIVYSSQHRILRRQRLFSPFVEKLYGARFDRRTLQHLKEVPSLTVTETRYLKDDTYLLIEGQKNSHGREAKPSR